MRELAKQAAASIEEWEREDERVLALIERGELDEAEAAARRMVAEHADATLGVERLGQVYEALGMIGEAATQYRRAVAIMDEHGRGHYCDCCRARLVKVVRQIDPDGPALELGIDPQ